MGSKSLLMQMLVQHLRKLMQEHGVSEARVLRIRSDAVISPFAGQSDDRQIRLALDQAKRLMEADGIKVVILEEIEERREDSGDSDERME